MNPQDPPLAEVRAWLARLGVGSLCAWDVLVFLHRHRSSLLGAEHLGLLVGYATAEILAALEALEAGGLLQRSHPSAGARLYQLTTPADPFLREALDRLFTLAAHRPGRLLVAAALLRRGEQAPPDSPAGGRGGKEPWLKVI
jgi:hypothetical protein